jgi:hypothetical protein
VAVIVRGEWDILTSFEVSLSSCLGVGADKIIEGNPVFEL